MGESVIQGRCWTYGDNINTDLICPAKYMELPQAEMSKHAMEGIDPEFPSKVSPGDIVVGGWNFGSGSSRETAPLALKGCRVGAVIARSFARIFFRNSINIGLPVIECPSIDLVRAEDILEIHLSSGRIVNLTRGEVYESNPLPEHILRLIDSGGLLSYLLARTAKD